MDGSQFDAWTRRGFGRGLGLALGGLAGISLSGMAGNKRRRRRRDRCHRVTQSCNRPADCCNSLACEPVDGLSGERCCRRQGAGCSGDGGCCGFLFCNLSGTCDVPESDRALKANFASVDPAEMLMRVAELPIERWSVARGGTMSHHARPHPADFAALFGIGGDETRIHVLDGQGVVLAAIQGAARLTADLHADTTRLHACLDALEEAGRAESMAEHA